MVVVSHDLGVVADICDDVAVMYAGQVVESGTATSVLDEPAHPYTQALLGANPHVPEGEAVPERLASIAGTVPAPGSWPTGCRFAGRCQFVQEKCTKPFPPQPAHGNGSVLRDDDQARTRGESEARSARSPAVRSSASASTNFGARMWRGSRSMSGTRPTRATSSWNRSTKRKPRPPPE